MMHFVDAKKAIAIAGQWLAGILESSPAGLRLEEVMLEEDGSWSVTFSFVDLEAAGSYPPISSKLRLYKTVLVRPNGDVRGMKIRGVGPDYRDVG